VVPLPGRPTSKGVGSPCAARAALSFVLLRTAGQEVHGYPLGAGAADSQRGLDVGDRVPSMASRVDSQLLVWTAKDADGVRHGIFG